MADPTNVVNPGSVNVADEAYDGFPTQVPAIGSVPASIAADNRIIFGTSGLRPVVVDQEILVGPSQNGGAPADGDDPSQVKLVASAVNQPVVVGPSQNPGPTTSGDSFKPGNANIKDVSRDRIADQVYGTGTPINVYP